METQGPLAGKRRLALVVGVGQYRAVPQLLGPAANAQKMYELLTDPAAGYGFPKENVCLLLEDAATKEQFKRAFQQCLVERAQNGDVVVLYFAGHGSSSRDSNGDEVDGQDETLMFVEARTDADHFDLVDDELNVMLSTLFKKMSGAGAVREQNVVVLLDSCNSGTAARDVSGGVKARFHEAATVPFDQRAKIGQALPGDRRWDGESLPGLVFLSAAIDGTSALEVDGEGLFTRALRQVLREATGTRLTYEQLILRMRPKLASFGSSQKIDVQGGTFARREVFGTTLLATPPAYRVKKVDATQLTLEGLSLPGWSPGGVIRIYSGTIGGKSRVQSLQDYLNPSKAKAAAVIERINGFSSSARLEQSFTPEPIEPGDLAMLAYPGPALVTLPVRILSAERLGGVPAERAECIRAAIARNPAARQTIQLMSAADKGMAWTVVMDADKRLQLLDPAGQLRVTYSPAQPELEGDVIARNLHQHARQKALLQLRGDAGEDFVNDETLQVWLEPVLEPNEDVSVVCPRQNYGYWDVQANGPGSPRAFQVPLCSSFRLRVKLSAAAPVDKLYVGGLGLSSDGSIFGFPGGPDANEDGFVALKPGQEWTFRRVYTGMPPVNTDDHILVFGNREANKIEWASLSEPSSTRGGNDLAQYLSSFLVADARGISTSRAIKSTTWTSTYASLRVVANSWHPTGVSASVDKKSATSREYTLQQYDIREWLPSNPKAALSKLLLQAHGMVSLYAENADGPRYNQDHEGRWEKLSDVENLAKGIDCSRAIWFAFTRAGLVYNNRQGRVNPKQPEYASLGAYVNTLEMVDKDSLSLNELAGPPVTKPSIMRDRFVSCRNSALLRPGDLLVYRRTKGDPKKRVDGHVVMVIDPVRFVAWGSHAYDANKYSAESLSAGKKLDSGVEYQQIRRLKTGLESKWQGWDSAHMLLVECWRHRELESEWNASPLNRPGTFDLTRRLSAP